MDQFLGPVGPHPCVVKDPRPRRRPVTLGFTHARVRAGRTDPGTLGQELHVAADWDVRRTGSAAEIAWAREEAASLPS